MGKASDTVRPDIRAAFSEPEASIRQDEAVRFDAETRSFLERPSYGPILGQVLRVVVITAAAVAAVKIAWILAVYTSGG